MGSDTSGLVGEAMAALQRRDGRAAMAMLEQAHARAPGDLNVLMNIALAQRVAGDPAGAIATLDRVLMVDPHHFMAMLSKGALVEMVSGAGQAASIYEDALKIAPSADDLPPEIAAPLARARQVVSDNADRLAQPVSSQVEAVKNRHGDRSLKQLDTGLESLSDRRRAYAGEPVDVLRPRLPATPFLGREHLPWLPELEAASDMIRGELVQALAAADADFAPRIEDAAGALDARWAEFGNARRWGALWLWRDGQKQTATCETFPGTTDLLSRLPLAKQPGFAPTALFSALEAHTHIPPHAGSTNARLPVHLPLILPGPARFRVGNDIREWKLGEAWAFDDTIEHEAWNDADGLRVILIFDVWNPLLSEAERDLIVELMPARKAFYAG